MSSAYSSLGDIEVIGTKQSINSSPSSNRFAKDADNTAQSINTTRKAANRYDDNDTISVGSNTDHKNNGSASNIITRQQIESSILRNSKIKSSKTFNYNQENIIGKVTTEESESTRNLVTVNDFYEYAIKKFLNADLSYGHTTFDAYEEASFLIIHTLKLSIDKSIENYASKNLKAHERSAILDLIYKRVNSRVPLPYLLKAAYQQGELFYVDQRVIIPRSYLGDILMKLKDSSVKPNEAKLEESTGERKPLKSFINFDSLLKENLNGLKLHKLIEIDKVQNILDLCTGSGCLAVLACGVFPSVLQVDAVDLSSDAIDVANINIKNKSLQNKITAYQGDLYNALSNKNRIIKYNLIISNPPYVDLEGMRNLPREFSYEPSLALNGGRDGLDIVNRILIDASENLAETGVLLCEIGRCQPQFRKKYPEFSRKILWVDTENSTGEVFLVTKNILLKYFG